MKFILGNCINLMQSPKKKISVLVSNGGDERFKASTKGKMITTGLYQGYDLVHYAHLNSPLPPNAKSLPAEVFVLIPQTNQLYSGIVENVGGTEPQKVKIVVTRKQLELLVRNARNFQISKINHIYSSHRDGCRKWQPSLAAIEE